MANTAEHTNRSSRPPRMSSTSHESGSEVDELASTPATSHSSVKDGEEGNETSFSIPDKLRKARTLQERNLARVVQSELDKERPLIEAFRRRVGSSQADQLDQQALRDLETLAEDASDAARAREPLLKVYTSLKSWLNAHDLPLGPISKKVVLSYAHEIFVDPQAHWRRKNRLILLKILDTIRAFTNKLYILHFTPGDRDPLKYYPVFREMFSDPVESDVDLTAWRRYHNFSTHASPDREAIPLPNAKTEPTSINEAQSTAAEKVEPSTNKEAQDVSINEPDPLPEEEIEPPHVDEAMSPTSDDEVAQQLTGSQTRLKEQSSVSDSDGQETVTSTSTTDRKRKRKGEVSTTSSKKHQKASSGQSPLAVVPTVTAQSATSITDDALAKALGRKSLPRERPLPLSALYFPSNAQAVQAVRSGSTPPDLQKAVQMSDLRQTGQGIQPSSPSTWNTARFAPSQIIDLCSDSSDESPSPPSPPDTTQEQAISNTNTKSLADAPTRIGLDQSERKTPGLDDAASNMSVAPRKEPRKPRPTLYPPSYYARNRTSSQQPAEGTVIHELAITQSMPTDRTSDSVVRVKQEGATSTHAERTGSADDQPHITVSVANVVAEAIDERAGDTAVGKIADLPRNVPAERTKPSPITEEMAPLPQELTDIPVVDLSQPVAQASLERLRNTSHSEAAASPPTTLAPISKPVEEAPLRKPVNAVSAKPTLGSPRAAANTSLGRQVETPSPSSLYDRWDNASDALQMAVVMELERQNPHDAMLKVHNAVYVTNSREKRDVSAKFAEARNHRRAQRALEIARQLKQAYPSNNNASTVPGPSSLNIQGSQSSVTALPGPLPHQAAPPKPGVAFQPMYPDFLRHIRKPTTIPRVLPVPLSVPLNAQNAGPASTLAPLSIPQNLQTAQPSNLHGGQARNVSSAQSPASTTSSFFPPTRPIQSAQGSAISLAQTASALQATAPQAHFSSTDYGPSSSSASAPNGSMGDAPVKSDMPSIAAPMHARVLGQVSVDLNDSPRIVDTALPTSGPTITSPQATSVQAPSAPAANPSKTATLDKHQAHVTSASAPAGPSPTDAQAPTLSAKNALPGTSLASQAHSVRAASQSNLSTSPNPQSPSEQTPCTSSQSANGWAESPQQRSFHYGWPMHLNNQAAVSSVQSPDTSSFGQRQHRGSLTQIAGSGSRGWSTTIPFNDAATGNIHQSIPNPMMAIDATMPSSVYPPPQAVPALGSYPRAQHSGYIPQPATSQTRPGSTFSSQDRQYSESQSIALHPHQMSQMPAGACNGTTPLQSSQDVRVYIPPRQSVGVRPTWQQPVHSETQPSSNNGSKTAWQSYNGSVPLHAPPPQTAQIQPSARETSTSFIAPHPSTSQSTSVVQSMPHGIDRLIATQEVLEEFAKSAGQTMDAQSIARQADNMRRLGMSQIDTEVFWRRALYYMKEKEKQQFSANQSQYQLVTQSHDHVQFHNVAQQQNQYPIQLQYQNQNTKQFQYRNQDSNEFHGQSRVPSQHGNGWVAAQHFTQQQNGQ